MGIQVPASIDATGASDVTAALQSFLTSVPSGSTVGFHGGQYRIDGQADRWGVLHLAGRGLTLDLQGGRLFRTTRINIPFILVDGGGTGFAIRNGTVEGYHPEAGGANAYLGSYSSNYGISIGGISNVEIGPNLTIQRFGGDAVYLNQGAGHWADGVRIHHSTLQLVGRNGVSWTDGARNVVVDFNTVADTGLYAFDIEPNGLAGLNIENVRVSDNVIYRYTTSSAWAPLLFAATGSASYERTVEFSRNTIHGQPLRVGAYRNANADYLTVMNNTSDTAGGFLEFTGVTNLSYSANTGAGSAVPVRITP